MPQIPADIGNQALDAIGAGVVIGSIYDGTTASEAVRRHYGQTLRQLLRTAHWGFARKYAPIQLLGDATGQTLDPASGLPISNAVEPPWVYAYAWPIDGAAVRWLPWNESTPGTSVPISTALSTPISSPGQRPARFLTATSEQFPIVSGQVDWDNLPDIASTEGVGLTGRRIILTNVANASLVYTKLVMEIEQWDPLFRQAFVSLLASRIAMAVIDDKKRATIERSAQVAIAKDAIGSARAATGNDAGFPQSLDHVPDWIRARRYGGSRWGAWGLADSPGVLGYGWDSLSLPDGSVF